MSIAGGLLRHRVAVESPPAAAGGAWTPVTTCSASSEAVEGTDPLTGSGMGMATYKMRTRYQPTIKMGMRGITGGKTRYFTDVRDPDGRKRELDITAVELVAETTVTISRRNPASYDPLTDQQVPGSISTATLPAFAVTPSVQEQVRYEANSWDVDRTITLVIVAAALGAHIPKVDDVVTWGAAGHTLREFAPIGPAAVPLFYRLVATR